MDLAPRERKNLPASCMLVFLELLLRIVSSSLVLLGTMSESVKQQRLDTEVVVCDVSLNRTVVEWKLSN